MSLHLEQSQLRRSASKPRTLSSSILFIPDLVSFVLIAPAGVVLSGPQQARQDLMSSVGEISDDLTAIGVREVDVTPGDDHGVRKLYRAGIDGGIYQFKSNLCTSSSEES